MTTLNMTLNISCSEVVDWNSVRIHTDLKIMNNFFLTNMVLNACDCFYVLCDLAIYPPRGRFLYSSTSVIENYFLWSGYV